jgi:hypothetical protein
MTVEISPRRLPGEANRHTRAADRTRHADRVLVDVLEQRASIEQADEVPPKTVNRLG